MLAMGTTARADRDYKENCNRRLEADRARIDRDASRSGEHTGKSIATSPEWTKTGNGAEIARRIGITTASMWTSTSVASQ